MACQEKNGIDPFRVYTLPDCGQQKIHFYLNFASFIAQVATSRSETTPIISWGRVLSGVPVTSANRDPVLTISLKTSLIGFFSERGSSLPLTLANDFA